MRLMADFTLQTDLLVDLECHAVELDGLVPVPVITEIPHSQLLLVLET